MSADSAPWEMWADTGGTFTDCIATSPGGVVHRVKVLSSSTLRGRVIGIGGAAALRVEPFWAGADALVRGFAFRPLHSTDPVARVAAFSRAAGELRLDAPVGSLQAPYDFELVSPEEAPVLAARIATGIGSAEPLPPIRMRLATTRGTNALLERRGGRVALFVTRGFRDVLLIGNQQRPELFTLRIEKTAPLYAVVMEVSERIAADGSVLEPLDEHDLRNRAVTARRAGVDSAAVALVNSTRNPAHEARVAEVLRESGFGDVSVSSALASSIGHLARAQTAVVNAYLQPVVNRYVARVARSLGQAVEARGPSLHLMTSSGGLLGTAEFAAKDSLLSGPAGGVVGAAAAGRMAGFDRLITFDMGGTSTDVARYDAGFDYVWSHRIANAELLAPALAIESVAAGGGSICGYGPDGLYVGPESAGAAPGPACYGSGGPLTVTDCNLLLGRIDPSRFGFRLDVGAAEAALQQLIHEIQHAAGAAPERDSLLAGLISIADERMADAIRAISLRRGYDPAEYALVSFGGAGGQHACAVAERLGMEVVVVPTDASLLSAWGLGHTTIQRLEERQILRTLDPGDGPFPEWLAMELGSLERAAVAAVRREGVPEGEIGVARRIANLRLLGQDATLAIDLHPRGELRGMFAAAFESVYGHSPEDRAVEVESLRVVASGRERVLGSRAHPAGEPRGVTLSRPTRRAWADGSWRELPVWNRSILQVDRAVPGPLLIEEENTSIFVPREWSLRLHERGALILSRQRPVRDAAATGQRAVPAPVLERLFTSRFERLVGDMGERLRSSALSTNVKERLDFSCALLDSRGELVANAPHIPVHLGALGLCVRAIASSMPLAPGDVVVTNHPAFGGSHLPDITVVTPVHSDAGQLLGYVANRAHHAEIGGTRPGSMPPNATRLIEEGVVIPPIRLVSSGSASWDPLVNLLSAAPFPSRAVRDNIADLRAQVAANHLGASLLRDLASEHGEDMLRGQMDALTRRAADGAAAALRRLGDAGYHASERLDDGSRICTEITVVNGRARFDFTGTSAPHAGNLNATPAIVRSAVLYVLRLLLDEPLPLNEGMLRPVEIALPRCLLNPGFDLEASLAPAVVGGNTEVSQRLVDTILKALGIAACSQGTMNNVLWGTDRFGYYETLAGGEGASAGHHGASGVHTHMTNTRITDAEVVEHRYPVRVERFSIRAGSGGAGAWRGGDGLEREITFLEPVELSVLTQHRQAGPYGLQGGDSGAPGAQWLVRADGTRLHLQPIDGASAAAGDRLVIHTPGGGGFGAAEASDQQPQPNLEAPRAPEPA